MGKKLHIGTVFIADDHELVLLGLTRLLEKTFSIDVLTALSSTQDIIVALEANKYDLYIIDLEFVDLSGFEIIRKLRVANPDAKIIVCTMHEELWTVKDLLSLSINGLVQKRSSLQYLVSAVQTVMQGKEFLCPRFSELKKKNDFYVQNLTSKTAIFTKTEQKVIELIVKGYATKKIAKILSVSDNTIESHRRSIFIKLNVKNVAQLVSVAITHRLVDIE